MTTKPHTNQIAKRAGMSLSGLSNVLAGRRRPSWSTAKRLAAATDTDPVLWLEGSPNEIKKAISQESDALTIN
ncbi:MAG: helix-turn-helix transcriptional regulator [Desulfatirhabdiaceae bacterium]|nr:helix-turn-helix transcriptional regulator [Desulfatirhabdiaceae bacterium]